MCKACWKAGRNILNIEIAFQQQASTHKMPRQLLSEVLLLVVIVSAAATANKSYKGYTVHVVFSNHLDVGFTDLDNAVVNLYFHQHFPNAIKLAAELGASPDNIYKDRFKYLTHSWLISLFLDCPPGLGLTCPNATEVAAVKAAIKDGVITWHAIPFNPQYEVFDADLLAAAVDLTHSLDARFGLPHKRMLSLRDVPGLTRAALPVLTSRGVAGITGGVNGFSAPPGVPKNTPFVWRDERSGAEVLAMWHPGGYAGHVNTTEIDTRSDCVYAEGLKHVLCASWGSDNFGPPSSLSELQQMFSIVRQQWPGARVIASSLDDYLAELQQAVGKGLQLPLVTGELGDTWIHGIAADPGRMADYRAVLRARHSCRRDPACDSQSASFHNFSRLLVKVAEHTCGVSFNAAFGDFSNYTNAWLHQLLAAGRGSHRGLDVAVESWTRQRQYLDWALEALPAQHPIRQYVAADRTARQQAQQRLQPQLLLAQGTQAVMPGTATTTCNLHSSSSSGAGRGSGGSGSSSSAGSAGGGDSAAAVGLDACDAGQGRHQLLFCSKYWLIQVDPETGGLLRLQRLYGKGPGRTAGTDWAAAAPAADAAAAAAEEPEVAAAAVSRRTLFWNPPTSSAISNRQQQQRRWQQQQQQQGNPKPVAGSSCKVPYTPSHKSSTSSKAAFAQLQYNVYNLDDYSFVWDNYAYIHPVWVGDFGKQNMSASSNLSAEAQAKLAQVYQLHDHKHGLMLHLQLQFPHHLVQLAGAPAAAWVVLHSPPNEQQLFITVAWQNKTVTRLPEALWLRFKPGAGAVNEKSWKIFKMDSYIQAHEILRNGSHSLHAVSRGATVDSRDGKEQLHLATLDVPLLNLGQPNPFPNPCDGPDMSQGVSYNIVNNIWGTNYAMWLYNPADANMAFRFVLDAKRL